MIRSVGAAGRRARWRGWAAVVGAGTVVAVMGAGATVALIGVGVARGAAPVPAASPVGPVRGHVPGGPAGAGSAHPGPGRGQVPPPGPIAGPGWTVSSVAITVDRRPRDYLLVRPTAATGHRLPVLVVLHGRGMTPDQMARLSGFTSVVGQAVIVYPAGLGNSWNAGACCATAHALGADDVKFLAEVVRNVLATQHDTSAASMFLVGYSNGGRMAYQMACQQPGLFRAIAAVEAVPVAACQQTTPVPLLVVASTGDPLVNIDGSRPPLTIGGFVEPTIAQVVSQWRSRDACPTSPQTTVTGQLTTTRWTGCRSGSEVALDVYSGNRHHWPAGAPGTPSAQRQVWSFFQRRHS